MSNTIYYFFPLILFIIGILIATSNDGLQAWLEKKEKKHLSHSLEGKFQTEGERKYFSKRYSEHLPWYKKLGKTRVEQINQDDKKYTRPVHLNYRPSEKASSYTRANIEDETKIIPELRKKVLNAKKYMDKLSESGEIVDYYDSIKTYYQSAVQLKEALAKANLEMPKRVETEYVRIGKDRTNKAVSRESEKLKEDVSENRFAFSYAHSSPIAERHGILEKIRKSYIPDKEVVSMEELERLHLKKGKTIPISRFTRENIFFHSFPLGSHVNLNTHGANYDSKTSIGAFLDYINRENPMLSVASMPTKGQENIMTRFAGIVLKEGKIYDASSGDLTSQANQSKKTRFRGTDMEGDAVLPIEQRIEFALNRRSYRQNEFIVGDYKIEGLYFDSEHLKNMVSVNELKKENIVPQIAKEALKRELPLYEVTKSGFRRVDPKKYLGR